MRAQCNLIKLEVRDSIGAGGGRRRVIWRRRGGGRLPRGRASGPSRRGVYGGPGGSVVDLAKKLVWVFSCLTTIGIRALQGEEGPVQLIPALRCRCVHGGEVQARCCRCILGCGKTLRSLLSVIALPGDAVAPRARHGRLAHQGSVLLLKLGTQSFSELKYLAQVAALFRGLHRLRQALTTFAELGRLGGRKTPRWTLHGARRRGSRNVHRLGGANGFRFLRRCWGRRSGRF